MRKALTAGVMGLALSMLLITASMAEDVYITKKGKRYHKVNSRFIKGKAVEKITREEAEKRGLKPSSEFLQDDTQPHEKK